MRIATAENSAEKISSVTSLNETARAASTSSEERTWPRPVFAIVDVITPAAAHTAITGRPLRMPPARAAYSRRRSRAATSVRSIVSSSLVGVVEAADDRAPGERRLCKTEERCHEGGIDDRTERWDVDGEEEDDHSQADEVVARSQQEPPRAGDVEVDPLRAEPARVDLDGEEDAEVVEQGRHDRPGQHRDVGDAEVLGDDERRGTQGGRREDRTDAGGGEHASGGLPGIAGALEDRPGDGAQGHRRRRARPGDGPEQEARRGDRAPRSRAGLAEQREAERHEEPARTHPVQDRAVDREQHDVGRRHVQWHPEEPARLVVERVDDLLQVQSEVGDAPADREVAAVVGVGEEDQAHGRQHQPRRTPGRLEHEDQQDRTRDDVEQKQRALPVQEAIEAAAAH